MEKRKGNKIERKDGETERKEARKKSRKKREQGEGSGKEKRVTAAKPGSPHGAPRR